jgi:hypothetical protein
MLFIRIRKSKGENIVDGMEDNQVRLGPSEVKDALSLSFSRDQVRSGPSEVHFRQRTMTDQHPSPEDASGTDWISDETPVFPGEGGVTAPADYRISKVEMSVYLFRPTSTQG